MSHRVIAAALALSLAALPALAESPADAAGAQLKLLLDHTAALRADLLRVQVEDQTVYVRGMVDNEVESAEVDQAITAVAGAHIVNATVVTDVP